MIMLAAAYFFSLLHTNVSGGDASMNADNYLLPVPVFSENNTAFENTKKTRKVNTGFFLFVFALYLLSTLLGSALVPGKLKLDSSSFLLSVTVNDATFLCAERCFFALFYLVCGFTFLRYPVSFLFTVFIGTYTGICIRLLVYGSGALSSVITALLLALQIIADVFCAALPLYFVPCDNNKLKLKPTLIYCSCFVAYVILSLLFSFLISLMLK